MYFTKEKIKKNAKLVRIGMPDELASQMPILKDVLRAMNITIIEKEGYEADDVLGTLSRMGENAGMDVVLLTGDRDSFQLATDKVSIYIPRTKAGKTETENYNRYGYRRRYRRLVVHHAGHARWRRGQHPHQVLPDVREGAVMTTNEERREVARRLRKQADYMALRRDWYEDDREDCVRQGNSAYRNIADSVEKYANNSNRYEEIVRRLADLVDRPTCSNVSEFDDAFVCGECRAEAMLIAKSSSNEYSEVFNAPFQPRYCPNCGREVCYE